MLAHHHLSRHDLQADRLLGVRTSGRHRRALRIRLDVRKHAEHERHKRL